MTERNKNPFIPFPPPSFEFSADWADGDTPANHVTVAAPRSAGVYLEDLMGKVELALVAYAYQQRLVHRERLVVYFSEQAYDFMATSGLDLRQWLRVRGAVLRTLPSAGVFLSFLGGDDKIHHHLFLVMQEEG